MKSDPTRSKSSWAVPTPSSKALYGLGAAALGAAAVGTVYYRREDFMNGWKYGYDHMTFVRNLWDEEAMRGRLVALDQLSRDRNVRFWKYAGLFQLLLLSELMSVLLAFTPTFRRNRPTSSSVGHSSSSRPTPTRCSHVFSQQAILSRRTRSRRIWGCSTLVPMTGSTTSAWRW